MATLFLAYLAQLPLIKVLLARRFVSRKAKNETTPSNLILVQCKPQWASFIEAHRSFVLVAAISHSNELLKVLKMELSSSASPPQTVHA